MYTGSFSAIFFVSPLNFYIRYASILILGPDVRLYRTPGCAFVFFPRFRCYDSKLVALKYGIEYKLHGIYFAVQRFRKEIVIHQTQAPERGDRVFAERPYLVLAVRLTLFAKNTRLYSGFSLSKNNGLIKRKL